MRLLLAVLAATVCATAHAAEEPVKIIASNVIQLQTPAGTVGLPIDASLDLSQPQPTITRAVILLHGKGRNVDGYYRGLLQAAHSAGSASATSVLVAPQFLNEHDINDHHLPANIVRWRTGVWEAGTRATGPAAVSAYDLLDSLFALFADKTRYPNLKEIVLAGHSGGGQAVQRYAVVGHAPAGARRGRAQRRQHPADR